MWLFEDQPAQNSSPVDLYLAEVDSSTVYLALLGRRYGYEDAEGVSATEREFDRAVERRKHRLVFLKDLAPGAREPKQLHILLLQTEIISDLAIVHALLHCNIHRLL